MDRIDRDILGALVVDGRLSVKVLAERIGLGASATGDRLRKLETAGVIKGYTVQIDAVAAGATIDALIDVQLEPGAGFATIDEEIAGVAEIVDAVHLTGTYDYQLRVQCTAIADLERVITYLKEGLGVRSTQTRIVLRNAVGMPRQLIPAESQ